MSSSTRGPLADSTKDAHMAVQGSILGHPVIRKEDPGILTGTTQYFDDLRVDGMLHAALHLADHARADIVAIDTTAAATSVFSAAIGLGLATATVTIVSRLRFSISAMSLSAARLFTQSMKF